MDLQSHSNDLHRRLMTVLSASLDQQQPNGGLKALDRSHVEEEPESGAHDETLRDMAAEMWQQPGLPLKSLFGPNSRFLYDSWHFDAFT